MMGLERNLSIFWSESAIYVALYAVFAIVVCSVFFGVELHHQTSNISWTRVGIKAVALVVGSVLLFTLTLYLSGWHSKLLGGEIL
ncbi:MAG: hypothetical protein AAGJ52_10975, partial [Pseudomonadota bacterium]